MRPEYLALANLLMCGAIAISSLCRLVQQECTANVFIRARYALFVAGSIACGFQPLLYGTIPSEGSLIFVLSAMLIQVIDSLRFWKERKNGTACPLY